MRYVFGFLCVCALGVMPLVGCSENGGAGGSGGSGGSGGGGTGGAEATGILDPTFDGDGIAVHDGAVGEDSSDYGYDITIDATGRILVAGYGLKSGAISYHMAIWRYDPDGTPDPSFGSDGVVVFESGADSSEGDAIEIDGAERVVVAGHIDDGPEHMAVWRYNSDGTPDPTFGVNGVAMPERFENDYGSDCAHDAAGRILVVGYSYDGDTDMVTWRLNADGTLDPTFGVDGIVVQDGVAGGTGRDEGWAITIDAAGKILVTGQSQNLNGNYDMVILRYNSDGTLDSSFGVDGITVHDGAVGGVDSGGGAIDIDATGKILVAGYSYNASGDWDMALWRYNNNGTPDSSFGVDGIVVHDRAAGGRDNDEAYDLAIDAAGKILVAGRSKNNADNYDMVIWRYNVDGTLDPDFGVDGIVVHDGAAGGAFHDYGYAITIDAAGRVLVSGTSSNDNNNRDMVVWRYR